MKKALVILPYANAHLGLFLSYVKSHFEVSFYIHKSAHKYRKYISENSLEIDSENLTTVFKKIRKGHYEVIFTQGIFYNFSLILHFTKKTPIIILSEMFREGYDHGIKGLIKKWHFSRLTKMNFVSIFMFGRPIVEEQYKKLTKNAFQAYKYGMYPDLVLEANEKNAIHKPVRFVFAGQFIKRKNIQLILQAIKLTTAFEVEDAEFIFIGEGTEKQYIEQNNFVKCTSTLTKSKLISELKVTDILVLVSAFEGWGAIVNEACSCGCALILGSNIGAGEVFLEENINGLYVSKNVEDISKAFQYCISNPEKVEKMKFASQLIFSNRYHEHNNLLGEIIALALSKNMTKI